MDPVNQIIQYVSQHNVNDVQQCRCAVQQYFDQTLWSLEKDEWQQMTEQQKDQFCQQVYRAVCNRVEN